MRPLHQPSCPLLEQALAAEEVFRLQEFFMISLLIEGPSRDAFFLGSGQVRFGRP
jgi:hypothetical protein